MRHQSSISWAVTSDNPDLIKDGALFEAASINAQTAVFMNMVLLQTTCRSNSYGGVCHAYGDCYLTSVVIKVVVFCLNPYGAEHVLMFPPYYWKIFMVPVNLKGFHISKRSRNSWLNLFGGDILFTKTVPTMFR